MKKKYKFIFVILILILFILIFSVIFLAKRKSSKTVNVAFYGLSADLCKAISEEFSDNQKLTAKFDILAADDFDLSVILKKYDIFFAWNGEVTDALSESAEKIPAKILENIPISLRNNKCVPVLLDNFEIAVNKEIAQKIQINPEESFQAFADFLHEASKYAFSPFFAEGSDDKILLALAGSFVQAIGGLNAYKNLINQMQTYDALEDFIDTGLNDDGFSFGDVLNMLKIWPKEELLHPLWTVANKKDLEIFAEQNQIASFFINLNEHRKIPYDIISKFEVVKMPLADENIPHCIIAPSVSCVLISDNSNAKDFLAELLSAQIQTKLSDKTMMACVNYQAEQFDSLCDDIRFLVASCEYGIMPDLENAVFQRRQDKMNQFAQEIRAYLK